MLADEQYAIGSGPAVTATTASGVQGNTLWALTDHLGSVRDLVDNNGVIREHNVYDSFGRLVREVDYGAAGQPIASTDPAAVDTLFGYTGRLFDPHTGLQYNRARWYDATTGRWLSQDPIGFAAGDANLYRYVGNGATNATDPSGLVEIEIWVDGKKYKYNSASGDVQVLRKGVRGRSHWMRLPETATNKIPQVQEAVAQLQQQFKKINIDQIESIYRNAACSEDMVVRGYASERLADIEQSQIDGIGGVELIDKLGLGVAVYLSGKQVYITVHDPTLENLVKASFRVADVSANAAYILGRGTAKKVAGRIIPITGIYFAVTEDIPDIINFMTELGRCANDYGIAGKGALDNAYRVRELRNKLLLEAADAYGIVDRHGGILTPLGGRRPRQ